MLQYQRLKQALTILFVFLLCRVPAQSQYTRFSISTDLGLQHNFKKEQRFTVVSTTTRAQFHLTSTEGVYVGFTYATNGNFKNELKAVAKSGSTSPQTISYVNRANMRLKLFSIGFKKYILGNAEAETGFNLYGYAGFGLLLGRVDNRHTVPIDTARYELPVLSGRANFKRLPIETGLGIEKYLGGDFYVFADAALWIPTDGYPSRYLFVNDRAPWAGVFGVGLRILF